MSLNHPDLILSSASDWVQRWLARYPPGSRVLDYACGYGRNTAYAVGLGMSVLAVDSDPSAVASVGSIAAPAERLVADLEHGRWPLSNRQFDVVIVSNYLFRARLDLLVSLVAPSGMLIYETFMAGNERYGRPASAKFLLQPNELYELTLRARLQPIAFEQGYFELPKPAMRQRICAVRAPVDAEIFKL
jgi:SAM-dependent methyltransferase